MQKVYYANARLNKKTMLLAGPFLTDREADEALNLVAPVAVSQLPELKRATLGIMQCNAPGAGVGQFNNMLPERLIGTLAVLANLDDKVMLLTGSTKH